jgi:porphobilinogen synthase
MISGQYPQTRMRRNRKHGFLRKLVQESKLTRTDLIYPIFVIDHPTRSENIPAMPDVMRLGFDPLLRTAELCLELGIPAIALFPAIDSSLKTPDAEEAFNPKGLIPKVTYELKKRFGELGIITDIALDPYTTHGQDGIVDNHHHILNDETIAALCEQALSHAQAGVDIVAPSDMMDGRISCIRKTLDQHGFVDTAILSYAAKYASHFYSPFREAVGSKKSLGKADKHTYQMHLTNSDEALYEASLDIKEGADILLVKPAMAYGDIIYRIKNELKVPTFAYQVSGEYAMLKAASQKNWLEEKHCVLEALGCIKRTGCNAIFSYYALQVAKWLQDAE